MKITFASLIHINIYIEKLTGQFILKGNSSTIFLKSKTCITQLNVYEVNLLFSLYLKGYKLLISQVNIVVHLRISLSFSFVVEFVQIECVLAGGNMLLVLL